MSYPIPMGMDKDAIIKLQKRARRLAITSGYREYAEDFSQFVLLQMLENPEKKMLIDYLLIDYLRTTFGQRRTSGGRIKSAAVRCPVSLKHATLVSMGFNVEETLISHDLMNQYKAMFKRGSSKEAVFELFYIQDQSQVEIARHLDLTEGAISRILYAIRNKVRKRIKLEKE